MANLGKLFAMLNQTYADSGIARVSQIFRDLVLYIRLLRQVFSSFPDTQELWPASMVLYGVRQRPAPAFQGRRKH